MKDLNSLRNKHGYQNLFDCKGNPNPSFVKVLDNFFLGVKQCIELGDRRRILQYLVFADNQNGSKEIEKFDRELATWNK